MATDHGPRTTDHAQASNQPAELPFSPTTIQRILPHRYPFLLVDRVIDLVPGTRIVGIKRFSANDSEGLGYSPQAPVVPAGILMEAMAQLGGILVLGQPQMAGKVAVILGVPSAQMFDPIRPGDTLRLEAQVTKLASTFGELRGSAYRDGILVAEGQMRFAVANASDVLPEKQPTTKS